MFPFPFKSPRIRVISRYPRGFTFVEVLVTSVIVASLAAIAVPIYTGYITSQKKTAAKGLAQSGAAAGNIFYRRTGNIPTVAQLNLFISESSRYKIVVNDPYIVVSDTSKPNDIVKDSVAFK